MTDSKYAIGVDIGGTKMAFCAMTQSGDIIHRHRIDTVNPGDTSAFVAQIAAEIDAINDKVAGQAVGVGVGCPGYVDAANGIIELAAIMQWRDFAIVDALYHAVKQTLTVQVENDVRALAIGEHRYGAAQGCNDFVMLVPGTGLGAAAMSGGRLITGARQIAMELGHIPVVPDGRQCHCGRRGCIEMYVAGVGLSAALEEKIPQFPDSALAQMSAPTNHDLIAHMGTGDPLAADVLAEATQHLKTLVGWCNGIFNPQRIIIGGGVGQALLPHVHDALHAHLSDLTLSGADRTPQLVAATLQDSAIGAASLVWG